MIINVRKKTTAKQNTEFLAIFSWSSSSPSSSLNFCFQHWKGSNLELGKKSSHCGDERALGESSKLPTSAGRSEQLNRKSEII